MVMLRKGLCLNTIVKKKSFKWKDKLIILIGSIGNVLINKNTIHQNGLENGYKENIDGLLLSGDLKEL